MKWKHIDKDQALGFGFIMTIICLFQAFWLLKEHTILSYFKAVVVSVLSGTIGGLAYGISYHFIHNKFRK